MENSKSIYKIALQDIEPKIFEKVAKKYADCEIRNDYSKNIINPYGYGADGNEDAYIEEDGVKFAFSIQKDWKQKIIDEIEKLELTQGIKPRRELYYITNQEITTVKENNFKTKQKDLIDKVGIILYIRALNKITSWLDSYLPESNDEELHCYLGLSGILVGNRQLNTFGITDKEIKQYNEETKHYEKEILIRDKTEYIKNSCNPIFDLICGNLKNREYRHYLISADAGMGKSYEIKKAVVDIYNKSRKKNEDISFLVQPYFYNLKNFHYNDNSPWKDVCPTASSEPFYVFLDGLDELSESDQVTIKKMIATELNTRKHTYFVISGRTSSFGYTGIEAIFNDKSKVNCHIPTPEKLLDIPFYRNIVDELGIKGSISLLELMDKLYKREFEKFLTKSGKIAKVTDKKYYKKLVTTLGDFARKQFTKEDNSWTKDHIDNFIESISIDDDFSNDLEFFIQGAGWISNNKGQYLFSHRIHQEYLIAFNSVQSVEDEIPKEFLAGEKNEIIKNKYSNIFALWLQLLDSKSDKTFAIKNNAIELITTKANIQIFFMGDDINLDETTRYSIIEYIIDNLAELPFLRDYIKEIASLVKLSTRENKLKLCNTIIEKIKMKFLNGTNNYIFLYIQILANITSKDDSIITDYDVSKIKKLIKLIIDAIEKSSCKAKVYNEFKSDLFGLDNIIKAYEPKFSAYRDAVSYKDIDEEYKRDFEVYQIARDFYIAYFSNKDNAIDVIEKYRADLLSIIADVAINYPHYYGSFNVENTITDEYIAPEPISLDTPVFYFEAFLDTFIEQDDLFKNTKTIPTKIPDSFRVFILKAIELLIDQCGVQKLFDSENSKIFQQMLTILARMADTLSITENKTLQTIIFSKLQSESNSYIFNYMFPVIKKLPDEYRKDWFNDFLYNAENNAEMTKFRLDINNVLIPIIHHKEDTNARLDYYLGEIKTKYDSDNDSFKYIYAVTLEILKDRNDNLFQKYSDDYNLFWGTRDELEKTRKTLLSKLAETAKKNIPHEIDSLFDKDIFKKDGFNIFDIMESTENKEKIFDCRYSNIENYIAWELKDDTDAKKIDCILNKFPNQIVAYFLARYRTLSKEDFSNWVDSQNWQYFGITKIATYIAEKDKDYEKELENRIDKIKEELSKNSKYIAPSTKLNLYAWFKTKDQFDIELIENDIDDIIKDGLMADSSILQRNSFSQLEAILDDDKSITINACIRYIDYVKKNKVEIIIDANGDSALTNVDFALSNVLKYLKQNYELIHNNENLNIKIIHIFLYALEKNSKYLCQECLSYFEDRHINEKEVFAKKIDSLVTKTFIDLLNKDVYYSFYGRLLVGKLSQNPKTSFPNTCKILKEKFNELDDTDDLKYTIALIILDKDSEILSWLIDYFIEQNGAIKSYQNIRMSEFNITSKYSFNDDDIANLLKLLTYAHGKIPVPPRRETLSSITLAWLHNSANKENFDKIKKAVDELTDKSDYLKNYINYYRWDILLEEKVFNDNELC